MAQITSKQYDALKHSIYMAFMNIKMYDSEGEAIEMGMGEMGEAEDAAEQLVRDWCRKENIEIID